MRRIKKLTSKTIKRIIVEERKKLENEQKSKLFNQLILLRKIKNRQLASLKEAKDLHEAKCILIKKIKGKK